MKSTGIVRKVDELGRIVIPKEIRRSFNIQDDEDSLEIFVNDNTIVLKNMSRPASSAIPLKTSSPLRAKTFARNVLKKCSYLNKSKIF